MSITARFKCNWPSRKEVIAILWCRVMLIFLWKEYTLTKNFGLTKTNKTFRQKVIFPKLLEKPFSRMQETGEVLTKFSVQKRTLLHQPASKSV